MMRPGPASLNAVYTSAKMRRRYEVWFLRLGLADGSGAWWFRYLLLNLGRQVGGCAGNARGLPAQVWATWFPRGGTPQTFLQGFPAEDLALSPRGASPFSLSIAGNQVREDSCRGQLTADGHNIAWDFRYRSTVGYTASDKGWIGFSRTPHADAVFAGEIALDGRVWRGDPVGYGVQGHNCGYRHRNLWNWTHAIFLSTDGSPPSTFEALEYEMPFGLRFRRAILWHGCKLYAFDKMEPTQRDPLQMRWAFRCSHGSKGISVTAGMDGGGPSLHRLPYLKTDCSGTFEVSNNSLARAEFEFRRPGQPAEKMVTEGGAVLEMAGG